MNYGEFEARANSAFDDCSEMKRMLWNMQTVVAAVPDMVRKNERLEKEKAELKAEIERLKSEVPDGYMKLPVDADGVPIRVGDEVDAYGNVMTVLGYRVYDDGTYITAKSRGTSITHALLPPDIHHRAPEPPDSWEKLEEDAMKTTCDYALAPRDEDGLTTCEGCRFQKNESCHHEMTLEVFKRAKRLAGVEEQEGGERTAIADKEER